MKYFCNATAWNWSPGPTKGNTQEILFGINQTSMLFNHGTTTRKTLKFNGRVRTIAGFFRKRHYTVETARWTKFPRNLNFAQIMGSKGPEISWNKIHNFLWIRSTSGKIMKYVFRHKNGVIHEIWAFWHFLS